MPERPDFFSLQDNQPKIIHPSYVHELIGRVAANWDEAKRQLYDGTFTQRLAKGGREDWAKQSTAIAQSQPDQDIGLFSFCIEVSLLSKRYTSTGDMLVATQAALKAVAPVSDNIQRILAMYRMVPRTIAVYTEEDYGPAPGFFYDVANKAYDLLQGLLPPALLQQLSDEAVRKADEAVRKAEEDRKNRLANPEYLEKIINDINNKVERFEYRVVAVEKLGTDFSVEDVGLRIVRSVLDLLSRDQARGDYREILLRCLRYILQSNHPDLKNYFRDTDLPILQEIGNDEAANWVISRLQRFIKSGNPAQDARQLLALDTAKALKGLEWECRDHLNYVIEIVRSLLELGPISLELSTAIRNNVQLPKAVRRAANHPLME